MTTALLLATARSEAVALNPPPAAHLPLGDGTVLDRLCGQLSDLGVRRTCILTRPESAGVVGRTSGVRAHEALDVRIVESEGIAGDLRRIARAAREAAAGRDPLVVARADLVAHREALASLLADSRITTGALIASGPAAGRATGPTSGPAAGPASSRSDDDHSAGAAPARVEHQRLVSAGSSYHRVSAPNASFLDVLRVGPGDAEDLAHVADRLAPLAESAELSDVPALLLVGLVRAGVYVGGADIRALRCFRVTDAAGARAANAALNEVDEDQVLLDSAVKADDGLFTTYCVSPYSKHVARWAAGQGLTPNAVSAISLGIGVAAAACFALGSRLAMVVGAVLLLISFVADCVDGQLARYTRTFSALGGWLDATFDRAKEYLAYAGLAVGAAASGTGGVWGLAVAALIMQTGRHVIDFGYAGAHPHTVAALSREPLDEPDDGMMEHVAPASSAHTRARELPGRLGVAATTLSRTLEGREATRWLKKVVILPIGERFALIAVTAALGGPRVTFVALLVWGVLAGAYTLAGRVLRSLARRRQAPPEPRVASASPTMTYRDDGPLARLVGHSGIVGLADQSWRGRSVALGATVLGMAGPLVALAVSALSAPATPSIPSASSALQGLSHTWLLVLGAAWCVLAAGSVSGHPHPGRLDWLGPPVLRLVEYTFVGTLGLVGGAPPALVFALLGAVIFHHYDTAYRVRQRSSAPPGWLSLAGLGWDGRMLIAAVAAAGGAITPVYTVLTVALWLLFVAEGVLSWVAPPVAQVTIRGREMT